MDGKRRENWNEKREERERVVWIALLLYGIDRLVYIPYFFSDVCHAIFYLEFTFLTVYNTIITHTRRLKLNNPILNISIYCNYAQKVGLPLLGICPLTRKTNRSSGNIRDIFVISWPPFSNPPLAIITMASTCTI